MSNKHDIIKAARVIVRKNKGYRAPVLIHSQRDWWIGILMFSIIVLAGGAVLARMYALNDSLDELVGAEANTIPRYREEVVRDVLMEYRTRAAAYQVFASAPALVPEVATSTDTTADSTEELSAAIDETDVLEEQVDGE